VYSPSFPYILIAILVPPCPMEGEKDGEALVIKSFGSSCQKTTKLFFYVPLCISIFPIT
jgi:hypothetical protein